MRRLASLRNSAAGVVGLVVSLVLFGFAQPPSLSPAERKTLAGQFKFQLVEMPPPLGASLKSVRAVHPSLRRLAAWISATGAAIALTDLDGDGLANDYVQVEPRTDEVLVGPVPTTGERFERFSLDLPRVGYDPKRMAPMGALAGDLNEDGLTDIVVYFWGRTPVAFLRSGAGADSSPPANATFDAQELVASQEVWNTGAALFSDLDGDGHADLVFGNYFEDGAPVLDPTATGELRLQDTTSRSFNGGRKHLLLWRSGRRGQSPHVKYEHRQFVFDKDIDRGWTVALGAADLDSDLLPELYFGHDLGPDRLMHNRSSGGQLKFAEAQGARNWFTPGSFVLGQDSYKGMGVDFGHLNSDLTPDIYVSNIACYFGLEESHFLWLSNGSAASLATGKAPYVQASEKLGLSRSGWSWDCRLADFNNDSVPEALQATGFIKGKINRWPELQALGTTNSTMLSNPRNWPSFLPGDDVSGSEPNYLFARGASGRYFDVAKDIGVDDRTVGRGIAVADIDGDGDLDFIVANQWEPSALFRNQCPSPGRFLGLKLLVRCDPSAKTEVVSRTGCLPSVAPAHNAVGAKATLLLPDGRRMQAEVDGGSGHSGKRAQELHFGLGQIPADTPIEVTIDWRTPRGQVKSQTLHLVPGWHTVELLWDKG